LGGKAREFLVDVRPQQLFAYGLSIDDVVKALGAENVLRAVGKTDDRHKLLLVLSDSRLARADEIAKVVVRAGKTGVVFVSDVAAVTEGAAPDYTIVTADNRRAVLINIFQQPDGNTVQIAADVRKAFDDMARTLPKGVQVATWYDQSELILGSAASVRDAVLIGVALAGLVLFLFLRSLKITLIALIVVPATLAITSLMLAVLGMSFNIMTLGGMAAAIGLIVDDAIVMIEQIFRRLSSDTQNHEVAITGAVDEFFKPLFGSSAVTTVIFAPLAFLSGVTGAFFQALSLTMACSLIVSFLIAWLVLPVLAGRFITTRDAEREAARENGPFARRYRSTLDLLLSRPLILVPPMAAFLGLGVFAYFNVGSGFMPRMDEGGFILDYVAPSGTSLPDTDELLQRVETILHATPEVLTYSRRTGAQLGGGLTEPNTGDYFIRLKPLPRRGIDQVMTEIRGKIERDVPGLDIDMFLLMEDLIGDLTAVPQPIEVKLYGDDLPTLQTLAPKVAALIGRVRGVADVRDGVIVAGDALRIKVDPVRAAFEGLDPDRVSQQIETFLSGRVATSIQSGERTIDVRVWVPMNQRASREGIARLPLTTPDGRRVPIGRVADITLLTGQPEITRENLKPMVAVTARIDGRDMGSTVAEVKAKIDASGLVSGLTYYEMGGLYAEQQSAQRGLIIVLVAAIALVFLLLLALYERFDIAVAVILMPLSAMAAVLLGLWLTGVELNISSMMGMTMIVGIVTEVAVFYMSELQLLQSQGVSLRSALVEAGSNRLRPIIMTTLAAILALLPLALGIGQGSAMQQPLAIAIVSGLLAQLPLVVLAMPVFLWVISRGRQRGSNRR
jgi:multidrug efflux pump subunit AcrB